MAADEPEDGLNTQGGFAEPPFPDDVAVVPPPPRITARFQSALNAALWQNHVPVLSELALSNDADEAIGDVEIELGCTPSVLRTRTWRLARVEPGQVRVLDDLDVPVDGPFLSGLTEATRGTVSLTARSGGTVVAEFTQDIRILAFNEWGGTAGIPDILAAFVQPNDPAVARIIRDASDLLRASGKSDSFEGYQGNKTRVWEQAQAIWTAVCRMDLRYINPPPSFVGGGQRIRSARQIVEERLATCLDLAVLFCSCLEAAGLRPLIVLQREHAFAGVWLAKGDFGSSTVDDAPGLRTRVKLDDLKLFETTGGHPRPQAQLWAGDASRGGSRGAGEGCDLRGADRRSPGPAAPHPAAGQRVERLRLPSAGGGTRRAGTSGHRGRAAAPGRHGGSGGRVPGDAGRPAGPLAQAAAGTCQAATGC